MNSNGLSFQGNPKAVAKRNAEIGMKMLRAAEEAGLIKIEKGQVVAPKLVTKDGKNITTESDFAKHGMAASTNNRVETVSAKPSSVRLRIFSPIITNRLAMSLSTPVSSTNTN